MKKNENKKKAPKLTLVRTTVLSLSDLRTVSGGGTFDCFVKISGGCGRA